MDFALASLDFVWGNMFFSLKDTEAMKTRSKGPPNDSLTQNNFAFA